MNLSGISARLAHLLELLLAAQEPVKVDFLAEALGTSRRTVFRELETAGPVLNSFQAELVSIPGKGIAFSGTEDARKSIYAALGDYGLQPASKRERLLLLVIEILANSGVIQKLFYYSNILKVSESTVSNDINELEPWFKQHGIHLVRKGGIGIMPEGTEEAIRTALVSRLITDGETGGKSYTASFSFPGDLIEQGVREVMQSNGDKFEWMTAESYSMITVYLMVMVKRIFAEKSLGDENKVLGDYQITLAGIVAGDLSNYFSVSCGNAEIQGLAVQIQACRAKQETPVETGSPERKELIRALTYEMIDRFDSSIAGVLKTNEKLVQLLGKHLGSALTRLQAGLDDPNPLQMELINKYPEVFQKTCRAVTAMEESLGFKVPVNEITYIEIHFLSALAALGEKNIRKRILRAGVICVAGIGTSYMVAAQIRKRFIGDLELDVCGWDDRESWEKDDFIISTIPLENTEKPVVLIQAILQENDYQQIQNTINAYAFVERGMIVQKVDRSLDEQLEKLENILLFTRMLLGSFTVIRINADCSFDYLFRFASDRFAPLARETIYNKLMDREKISSQVIPDLGVILLHTRSDAITIPVFAILKPDGEKFKDEYFRGAKSCVVMLLPEAAPAEMTDLMGGLSSALIDVPAFLDAIHDGNEKVIKALLEAEISDSLLQYSNEKLKK
ncbi:HTH domain protein [Treponema primitia ZAS-2]|uniref:HTH domain protein n=1 Tax=Treponema primitia (strain ATCC BAA-887 / DSM 12427 / ZAS-2) TaxID=545694 RepID=F5YNL6_TREPZ|nr:PRD domain-containing protein [Treponema primitia]AEF85123.1 HTH domain protein [Treponema primitia ZAS-2]